MYMMKLRLILTLILLSSLNVCFCEEITEANYLREDSVLWGKFYAEYDVMQKLWQDFPEKRDSLQAAYEEMYESASRENRRLAMKYASVPSGLQRLYMVRLELPKDTVRRVFDRLPDNMKESFYGECIKKHLDTVQVEEGDSLLRFYCIDDKGMDFDWSVTDGKKVLLLYGGLGCMGESGRKYLQSLYDSIPRDKFLIIVYHPCSSLENLRKVREVYPSEFVFISDFLQNASPMKIVYGTQATPTCFLFDEQHILKVKSVGIDEKRFNQYLY